jgi:hypothetical protein
MCTGRKGEMDPKVATIQKAVVVGRMDGGAVVEWVI